MNFEEATRIVETGNFKCDDLTKLRLYALYKLATGQKPSEKRDPISRAKYDTWNTLKNMVSSQDEARQSYISEVSFLLEGK